MAKVHEWIDGELADALKRSSNVQVEIHIKGKSVLPSLRTFYNLTDN